MEKCKCIKESIWCLLDDSEEQNLNGGLYTFEEGSSYEFEIENTKWGMTYTIKHNKGNTICVDKKYFKKHFCKE